MTLIKSISGIRGTIGGEIHQNLTPTDIVKYAIAYASWLQQNVGNPMPTVVVGRDARISGDMLSRLITASLNGMGCHVIDIGMATTPTTEMAVVFYKADGGIILTASHNPANWNALKLLNNKGEFLSATDGKTLLNLADNQDLFAQINYPDVYHLGTTVKREDALELHIQSILSLPYIDKEAIKEADFRVAIDCVNSVGGIAVPALLNALGVKDILELYTNPNGNFPHNPEPLPENLVEISQLIQERKADVGFVVDPDVDRLAILDEAGNPIGEENSLIAIADFFLGLKSGNTVSNLSSSRGLSDITLKHGGSYAAAAVGEVNVVEMMKSTGAVIGGEGNGGIILPELHYGRDSLVGIALFLTYLAKSGLTCSNIKNGLPVYFISKNKITLNDLDQWNYISKAVQEHYKNEKINTIDGVKIDFADKWVHLRTSNTEPIIRIYAEAKSELEADGLIRQIQSIIAAL